MNEQIDQAEYLDQAQSDCNTELGEISGSLEAITSVMNDELETVKLTDKQQAGVTAFKQLSAESKRAVYGIVDKAALEGFMDLGAKLAKKAAISYSGGIKVKLMFTAKALNHYVDTAKALQKRLEALRPLLAKRDIPFNPVFDYGAYSRFFMVDGVSLKDFTGFRHILGYQVEMTDYCFTAIESYAYVVTERLKDFTLELQSTTKPSGDKFLELRDSLDTYWNNTWGSIHAKASPRYALQTPKQAFPDANVVNKYSLFDNRYLVVYNPKKPGGNDYAKSVASISNYGAAIIQEKSFSTKDALRSMEIPACKELLDVVDTCIRQLHDFHLLGKLATDSVKYAKTIDAATNSLLDKAAQSDNPEFFSFIAEYFKVLAAITTTNQQPYVAVAWSFIRVALVVAAMAELAVLEESDKQVIVKRFATKQNTEFNQSALEGYESTIVALKAARRVLK